MAKKAPLLYLLFMEPFDLKRWIDTEGLDLQWTVAGVSAPEFSLTEKEHFLEWIKTHSMPGLHYLERRKNERLNPQTFFPAVKSILCFGLYYFPGWADGEVKISNYAWGKDYHLVLREKLLETAEKLQKALGPFQYQACVDTSPVLEKILAAKAGLGWQGKNSLLLHRKFGSYLFLGELFTDIPLERFQIQNGETNHCGTCTRCIDACPTEALQPYQLNAKKCISYWNLEHKGDFTEETPKFHGWLAGCDICQEACPWNQKLIPLKDQPKIDLNTETPFDHLNSTLKDTALTYLKQGQLERNLAHLQKDQTVFSSKSSSIKN